MAVTKNYQKTKDAYAPFNELLTITPSDVTIYDPPLRGVLVQTAGNVAVETEKGDASVILAVTVGQLIPALITQVLATGTTATVIGGR